MKFCPNCGAKIIKNSKFCHECGYAIQQNLNEVEKSQQDIIPSNNDISIDEQVDIIDDFSTQNEQANDDMLKDNDVKLLQKGENLFINNKLAEAGNILFSLAGKNNPTVSIRAGFLTLLAMYYSPLTNDAGKRKAIEGLFNLSDVGNVLADIWLLTENFINEDFVGEVNENIVDNIHLLEGSTNAIDQYLLAQYYNSDLSDEQDSSMAFRLYQKSAKQGFWAALSALGDIYLDGINCVPDVQKAISYFEKAAIKNDAHAAFRLGVIYSDEQFLPQNINKAKHWYRIAAKQNNEFAFIKLADIALKEKEYISVIDYYQKNIDINGSVLSAVFLASFYLGFRKQDHPNFRIDIDKGIKLAFYALELDKDNGEAQLLVAKCYIEGVGVSQDFYEAEKYLKLALNSDRKQIRIVAQSYLDDLAKLKYNTNQNDNSDGCFITTAVCDSFNKLDDCYELTMFRDFRDNWLKKQPKVKL